MSDESPDRPEFADASFHVAERNVEAIERVWRTVWIPLIAPKGQLILEALKGELYDAAFLVDNARKVYRAVTGGLCSDLTASAEGVIALYQKHVGTLTQHLRERIDELESTNTQLRAELLRTKRELKEAQEDRAFLRGSNPPEEEA